MVEETTYYLVNKAGQPLSAFYPNDKCTLNQLKFQKSMCLTFRTKEEAENYLEYIKENCTSGNPNSLTINTAHNWRK